MPTADGIGATGRAVAANPQRRPNFERMRRATTRATLGLTIGIRLAHKELSRCAY
jgi:hypothetical protein